MSDNKKYVELLWAEKYKKPIEKPNIHNSKTLGNTNVFEEMPEMKTSERSYNNSEPRSRR